MKRLLLVAGLFLLIGLAGTSAAQERPGPQHSAPERPSAPPSPPPAAAPPPPSSMGAPPSSGGSSGGGSGYAVPRDPGAGRYRGDDGRVRTPKSGGVMTSGSAGEDQSGRRRVPSAGSGSSGGSDQSGRRRVPVAGGPGGSGSGGAVDRYSRPRNGRPVTGVAVPRQGGIYRPGYGYNYPSWRSYYPYYGIGAWGVGMWYYDPWFWDPYGYGYGMGYGYGGYGGYGGYYRVSYDDTGSLRLKVKPRNAQVFVDGYYVGVVDEYDGTFQRLRVERGPHRIEVRLDGFETLSFDVRVLLDHTITLHGELKPAVQ